MTNPDDPRDRPWDDGTANPPPERPEPDHTNEAWQAYPDSQPYPDAQPYPDQPTQQYPTQQYPDQQYPDQQYPYGQQPGQDQPTQQYPTQQYPPQQYGCPPQPYAQQPNPTQVFPPYDPSQHQAAHQYGTQQYGTQQYATQQGYGQPPTGTGETPYTTGDSGPGGNSPRKWIFALVALAALAVVVLAGILVVTNQKSEPSTTALPSANRPVPTTAAPAPSTQAPVAPTSPNALIPGGIPEILGNSGAAIGTIDSIDGSTLSIIGMDGAPVTVLITPQTQVLSLSGFDASSLKVGSLVVVNGTPMQDGTITADVIVETPDLGG